jgi:hypothetical protein
MTSTDDENLSSLTREQVLDLPRAKKLLYFREHVVVRHPKMEAALNDVVALSEPNGGTDILLLVGPTGVGKSATIKAAAKMFLRDHHEEMVGDPGYIPFVSVAVPASTQTGFSWGAFYTRLGEALREPLLQRKIPTNSDRVSMEIHKAQSGSVAALREAVENALKHRRTQLVVLDEGAHLLANCGSKSLVAHMNVIKSLANEQGSTLALVGSYDLYQLLMLNGQLARRSAVIHMSRYLAGQKQDADCFRRSLRTLVRKLPIREIPDLERYSEKLQIACVGCVGVLKDTLTRALVHALRAGGRWSDDHLRRALLSEAAISRIYKEAEAGERLVGGAVYGGTSETFLMSA